MANGRSNVNVKYVDEEVSQRFFYSFKRILWGSTTTDLEIISSTTIQKINKCNVLSLQRVKSASQRLFSPSAITVHEI